MDPTTQPAPRPISAHHTPRESWLVELEGGMHTCVPPVCPAAGQIGGSRFFCPKSTASFSAKVPAHTSAAVTDSTTAVRANCHYPSEHEIHVANKNKHFATDCAGVSLRQRLHQKALLKHSVIPE